MTNADVATRISKSYYCKQPDTSFKESAYKNAVSYRSPMQAKDFPFRESIQIGSMAYATSYSMGTGDLFLVVKRAEL